MIKIITQLNPAFANAVVETRPQDLFLQKESWVYFSDAWPSAREWAKGKLFRVIQEPLIVPYAVSYILPSDDWKEIDLSNASAGIKLYPEDEGVLYQVAVGLKPGDYLMHTYIPKNSYIYALGQTTMYPDVSDAAKKYLGAKTPSDTPHTAPMMYLYLIKDAPAVYLRFYVLEGVAFEKCTCEFHINKLKLEEIEGATPDMIAKARRVGYYTEFMDA